MQYSSLALSIIIALIFGTPQAGAQITRGTHGLLMDVHSSFESGWWVYDRGNDPDTGQQLGWDRSDNENTIAVGLDLWYQLRKMNIGIGTSYNAFFETKMEAFEDQLNGRKRYPVSGGAVTFLKYYLQLEYALFQGRKYDFNLHGRFGGFSISTTHPEKDNFGLKTFFEVGITNQVHFKHVTFLIRPKYSEMTIRPVEEQNPGEIHKIRSYGISFGIRYQFGKK